MNCMKCGRKLQEEAVFCKNCLADMENYPVPFDAAVHIPEYREPPVIKIAPKRYVPTQDEQNLFLRKCLMILVILLSVCIVAIVLMFKPTIRYLMEEHYEIGQNYSSVTSTSIPTVTSD